MPAVREGDDQTITKQRHDCVTKSIECGLATGAAFGEQEYVRRGYEEFFATGQGVRYTGRLRAAARLEVAGAPCEAGW